MFELVSKYADDLDALKPVIESQWDWMNGDTPDQEVQRALGLVRRGMEEVPSKHLFGL